MNSFMTTQNNRFKCFCLFSIDHTFAKDNNHNKTKIHQEEFTKVNNNFLCVCVHKMPFMMMSE